MSKKKPKQFPDRGPDWPYKVVTITGAAKSERDKWCVALTYSCGHTAYQGPFQYPDKALKQFQWDVTKHEEYPCYQCCWESQIKREVTS